MHRQALREAVARFAGREPTSREAARRVNGFVADNADCFERERRAGHLTASAWIVDPQRRRAVLVHHRKLGRWLQPGGHADGERDLVRVALREAREETGLASLRLTSEEIFDLDLHEIPATAGEAAHWHYDVRFLFEADPAERPVANAESHEVRWIAMRELGTLGCDASVLRMAERSLGAPGETGARQR